MAIVNNKKYYFSNYVIFQKLNSEEYVLIHSYLNNIDIIDEFNFKQLLKIINNQNVQNFDEKVLDELIQKGYLVEDPIEDKKRFLMIAEKLDKNKKSKQLAYILIPTYNCNFSCPYCFEGNLTRSSNNVLMNREMVDIIFNIIAKDKSEGRSVSLSLFGGEPLLKENIAINEYIFEKAKQQKLKISVITNGYDLDYYISYIKKNIFSDLQITLDGDQEQHNRNKFTKSDNDTFSKILNNIALILKTKTKLKINIRINVNRDNIISLKPLYQIFENYGFLKDKRFSFYTKSVSEYIGRKDKELSDMDIVHEVSFFNDAIKNMETNSQYAFIIKEMNAVFDIKRKFGNFKIKYCGATGNNRLIDPYGDVYSCLEEVGKKDRRVGFIDKENKLIVNTPLMGEWLNRDVRSIEECSNCEYALICGGGCGIAAYRNSNSLQKPWCSQNKEIAKEVICEITNRLSKNI